MNPGRLLYTKQQIAELTGLSNSTLNYWMREGVLVHTAGGSGRGDHRRFAISEIHIAAILGEMLRYGVNQPSLKRLAEKFHEALDWADRHGLNVDDVRLAYLVASSRADYNRWGYYPVNAAYRPEREPDSHSRLTGDPMVHLTWEETVEYLTDPNSGHSEIWGSQIEPWHVDIATKLGLEEIADRWDYLRRIIGVHPEAPKWVTLSFFIRDADGEWHIEGTAEKAATLGRSFIAIDVPALIHDLWNEA